MGRVGRLLTGVLVAAVLVAAVDIKASRLTFPLVIAGIAACLFWYWLRAVIDLLRSGPGGNPVWWAGTLAVVVLLGPVGALAFRLAGPRFDRSQSHPLDTGTGW